MADSSKTRIEQLRNEIAKLDQEIFESERPVSPPISLTISAPRKGQDRSSLQQRATLMRASILGKEEHLFQQQMRTNNRLKDLARHKQTELQNARQLKEPLLQQLESLESYADQLQEAYLLHSSNLEKISKKKNSARQANISVIEQSIEPLENQTVEFAVEKSKLIESQVCLQQEMIQLGKELEMVHEDLLGRKRQQAEFIAQREEIEEQLDYLKAKYPDEFQGDWNLLFECSENSKKKQDKIDELKALDSQVKAVAVIIQDLKHRTNLWVRESVKAILATPNMRAVEEIDKLEIYLKTKAAELGIPPLDSIIAEVNSADFFDIDEEIIKLQLNSVMDHQRELQRHWDISEKRWRDQAKILSDDNDWDGLEALEDKVQAEYRSFRLKVAALTQWTTRVSDSLPLNKLPIKTHANDVRIIEEFRTLVLSKVFAPDARKSIEHMINVYILKLNQRENVLKSAIDIPAKSKLDSNLRDSLSQKYMLEDQRYLARQELMSYLDIENRLKLKLKKDELNYSAIHYAHKLSAQLEYWDRKVNAEGDIIYHEVLPLQEKVNSELMHCSSKASEIKKKLDVIGADEQAVNLQLEQLLDAQRVQMAGSLADKKLTEHREVQSLVRQIHLQIQKVNQEKDECLQELQTIDKAYEEALNVIEDEEAGLMEEMESLTSSVQDTQIEKQKISEMENRLSNPFADSRSRSMNKLPGFISDEQSRKMFEDPLEFILPLLEGSELYKKFSQRSSLIKSGFDPLDSDKNPPEACGFGIRYFQLHKSLNRIEIKQPFKPGVENTIPISKVLSPFIPQRTMTILKIQKNLAHSSIEMTNRSYEEKAFEDMREWGVFDMSNLVFQKKCKECSFYPFSIVLEQEGRVEVVAKSYASFRLWINGINALVKHKKNLQKLRSRLEVN